MDGHGILETWPDKTTADARRIYWAAHVRMLPEAAEFGVTVRRIPGSSWFAVVIERLDETASNKPKEER